MKPLQFSFANCLADRLGDSPIALRAEEQAALLGRAAEIVKAVAARRKKGELAFLGLSQQGEVPGQVAGYVRRVRLSFDTYVNLGIGGSSLGAIALMGLKSPYHNELDAQHRGGMRCYFPENVDPATFAALLARLDPARTLFGVISKSGSTAETMSQYLIVRNWLAEKLGPEKVNEHLVFVTDAKEGFLRPLADKEGIASFVIPDGVGGRFSVLSPVGLLPAACAGLDVPSLLSGAAAMEAACASEDPNDNPALMASVVLHLLQQKGANLSVLMPYADAMAGLARWYVQLVSESLGKRADRKGQTVHTGITPLPAIGATDQHSQVQLFMEGPYDKCVAFIALEQFEKDLPIPAAPPSLPGLSYLGGHTLGELLAAEQRSTEMALAKQGRPSWKITVPELNEHALGQLFYFFELMTVYLGEWLDIDAFDQPGVELGKQYTYGLMGRKGFEAKAEEVRAFFKA